MLMKTTKRSKPAGGFTFNEVMAAILVLTIAVLGTSAYRYHASVDVRKADQKTTGARTASLLCETWRGSADPNAFDPVSHFGIELTIASVSLNEAPPAPIGCTTQGAYKIIVDEVDYRAVLFYRDISPGLRALSVIIVWEWNPQGQSLTNLVLSKSFRLTTYITL
jgi:hypothetical protein